MLTGRNANRTLNLYNWLDGPQMRLRTILADQKIWDRGQANPETAKLEEALQRLLECRDTLLKALPPTIPTPPKRPGEER